MFRTVGAVSTWFGCIHYHFLNKFSRCRTHVHINQQVFNITTDVPRMMPKNELLDAAIQKTKTKKPFVPRITLLNTNNTILSVVPLEEAKKIAESKNLKLVKILDLDTATQRPVYRLMTAAQYLEEDYEVKKTAQQKKKEKHIIKGEKLIMISSRISENDLASKVKHVKKWLLKKNEVRMIIANADDNKALSEKVYEDIESQVKDIGRIVQKRYKEHDLRFSILPPKEAAVASLETAEADIVSELQDTCKNEEGGKS